MIELKITGNTFTEINEQLMDVVNGIGRGQTTVSVAPQVLPDITPASVHTSELAEAAENKKKRRTKAEVEADKAEALAKAQAEVQAAQASHVTVAAVVIPPMPTTNHVVDIPTEQVAVQQPVVHVAPVAPVIAPPVNQNGAYNLETFKINLVTIISGLLTSGKLNSEWIAKTAKETFAGQDIWLWSANEPKIEELFNCFIEWNLIQKFEG
jgi:hypothetical protein